MDPFACTRKSINCPLTAAMLEYKCLCKLVLGNGATAQLCVEASQPSDILKHAVVSLHTATMTKTDACMPF